MYKIKNIKPNSNISIGNRTVKYDETLTIDEETLDIIQPLIEKGMITIEPIKVNRRDIKVSSLSIEKLEEIKSTKEDLIEIFFKFHLNSGLNKEELSKLIWFFKNVSPISQLPQNIKDDLDDISSDEELIEILVNHIYPVLIDNFFNNVNF